MSVVLHLLQTTRSSDKGNVIVFLRHERNTVFIVELLSNKSTYWRCDLLVLHKIKAKEKKTASGNQGLTVDGGNSS